MEASLLELQTSSARAIAEAPTAEELEALRVRVLGRKGALAEASKEMAKLSPADRARVGKLLNETKRVIETALEEKKAEFDRGLLAARLEAEWVDLTRPAAGPPPGSLHPLTQIRHEIEDLFRSLGFRAAICYARTRLRFKSGEWRGSRRRSE